MSWTLPAADQPRLLQSIINRVPGKAGVSQFATAGARLGDVRYGGGGAQGASPAPGALFPVTVPKILPAAATELSAATKRGIGQLDAIQLTPCCPPWSPTELATASPCSAARPTTRAVAR